MTEHAPTLDAREGGAASPPRPWRLRWWDLSVCVVMGLMGVYAVVTEIAIRSGRPDSWYFIGFFGTLGTFVGLYVWLGRPALTRVMNEQPSTDRSHLFLGLVSGNLAVAAAVDPTFASLQAIAYPLVWNISDRFRTAVSWNSVVAIAVGIGLAASFSRLGAPYALTQAAIIAVLSFAFSLVMGTWITHIAAQGERHRLLAQQLRTAQSEVAALSAASGAAAERERLSRELHDTLTQTLSGLVMMSEQAGKALANDDAALAAERIDRVEHAGRLALQETRALVATTQPLRDGGLDTAIRRIAERLQHDSGLQVHCEFHVAEPDREHQVVLLRAAQEGLANARKHSRARSVWVSIEEQRLGTAADPGDAQPCALVLTVDDDGVGPGEVLPSEAPRGFGLEGMRDRVELVGGSVSFGVSPRGGARLRVRLPVRARANGGQGSEASQ